jgi:hypothetical protein
MNVDLQIILLYSAYLLTAIVFDHFETVLYSCWRTYRRGIFKILEVICSNLVKLLGGCLPRRKNEAAVTSMKTFQEYIDDEQKTYRYIHHILTIISYSSIHLLQLCSLSSSPGITNEFNFEKFSRFAGPSLFI